MPNFSKSNLQNERDIIALTNTVAGLGGDGPTSYDAIQDVSITAAGSSVWNGLTKTDNSIGLGGTLEEGINITGGINDYFIIDLSSGRSYLELNPTGGSYGLPKMKLAINTDAGNAETYLQATGTSIMVAASNTSAQLDRIVISAGTGINFDTASTLGGAYYQNDYSAAGISSKGARWIPDAGWVYTAIDASATNKINVYSSPASNAAGTLGDIALDPSYFYICTSTNTWGRMLMETGY